LFYDEDDVELAPTDLGGGHVVLARRDANTKDLRSW
jgi:hypothetical protein